MPEERARLQLLLAQFYDFNDQVDQAIATLREVMQFDAEIAASFPAQKVHGLNVYAQMGNCYWRKRELNSAVYWWEQHLARSPTSQLMGLDMDARRQLAARGELTEPPMLIVTGHGFIRSRLTADGRRLLVPAAKLAEALGVECAAGEDGQAVTLTPPEGPGIQMRAGSAVALVGGEERTMQVAPQIIEGELWVPLRFTAEALGHTVEWEAAPRIAWVR
ncbi:MAG: stalk domain-containing protein [Armatimonadota bacterium]